MSAEHRVIRVLIIEDDPFITMVYQDQLSDVPNIRFDIDAFETMEEGLHALKSESYDVLLLDLNLPDSDSDQTIARLDDISHDIPVLIMTSTNDEVLALSTMHKGVQDYLLKERVDKAILIRSILYSIERQQLKKTLRKERRKSENLLRNILPESIAGELKEKGKVQARKFDSVSVMFVDFTDFTRTSEKLGTEDLVLELDLCFSRFDEIIGEYGLEKIKTIGDAYMAAGGIPEPKDDHPSLMLHAAREFLKFIENRKELKDLQGEPFWSARIGIHAGPVIAGVVGKKKFTYDIWGDTVNVASRLESNSIPGRINVSKEMMELASSDFQFEDRGEIAIKGKSPIRMYFLKP